MKSMEHAAALALMLVAGLSLTNDAIAANCSASVRYLHAEARDAKGFKQALSFGVSSNRAGRGLINYTIIYADKTGEAKTKSGNAPFTYDPSAAITTELADGTTITEITVTDETVLDVGACTDSAACRVTMVSIDKASCYAAR